jgi:aspartokinase
VRPELAAFRDLETLVRNLGDQLAGYRRRALAAESRTRELEQAADVARAEGRAAQDRAEGVAEQLAVASGDLDTERRERARASAAVEELEAQLAAAALAAAPVPGQPVSPSERALVRENAELKRRLEEASARTRELGERMRFLRQQLATVPEK